MLNDLEYTGQELHIANPLSICLAFQYVNNKKYTQLEELSDEV